MESCKNCRINIKRHLYQLNINKCNRTSKMSFRNVFLTSLFFSPMRKESSLDLRNEVDQVN